jgi:hypothetical protein
LLAETSLERMLDDVVNNSLRLNISVAAMYLLCFLLVVSLTEISLTVSMFGIIIQK